MPEGPLSYESGRYVKENFVFSRDHQAVLAAASNQPLAGVMVGDQTIDWFTGKHYVSKGYENYYHGAWQVMKDLGYDSEPFLDYLMTPGQLARYKLVYLPNAACLSDAQCAMLRDYVTAGGTLIATHLTSVADEHGKMRANFGLADLFGVRYAGRLEGPMHNSYLRLEADAATGARHPILAGLDATPRIINGVWRVDVAAVERFPSLPLTLIPSYPDLPMEKVCRRPTSLKCMSARSAEAAWSISRGTSIACSGKCCRSIMAACSATRSTGRRTKNGRSP